MGQLLTVALLLGLALMVLLEFAGPELLHVLGATAANEDQARKLFFVGVLNVVVRGIRRTSLMRLHVYVCMCAHRLVCQVFFFLFFTSGLGVAGRLRSASGFCGVSAPCSWRFRGVAFHFFCGPLGLRESSLTTQRLFSVLAFVVLANGRCPTWNQQCCIVSTVSSLVDAVLFSPWMRASDHAPTWFPTGVVVPENEGDLGAGGAHDVRR